MAVISPTTVLLMYSSGILPVIANGSLKSSAGLIVDPSFAVLTNMLPFGLSLFTLRSLNMYACLSLTD